MIRNIIFDFGGVIAPIDRDRAVQAFIRLGLKDADSRLDKYHQTGISSSWKKGPLRNRNSGRLSDSFADVRLLLKK